MSTEKEHYEGAFIKNPPFTQNYGHSFLVFSRGKGVWLWDRLGKKYLDFSSGIAVNSFGHGRKDFAALVKKQMSTLAHTSNLFTSESTLDFARRLVSSSPLAKDQPFSLERYPGYFGGVHLGNSGTEANEGALKYARIYAKRKPNPNGFKILAFENSFHGRTMGALSVTASAKYREPSEPLIPGVVFLPYNDCEALEKTLSREFCAVIAEPLQGEGGLDQMSPAFVQTLNKLCKDLEVVLIADEIQCGMGRTGTLFASEALGLEPDIITLAKPLAGGLPASATLVKPAINDLIHPGDHGSTFGGNPVAAALGCKVWDILSDPETLKTIQETSKNLGARLDQLKAQFSFLGKTKGKGLLLGIEIMNPKNPSEALSADAMAQLLDVLLDTGIIVLRAGKNILRLAPPLSLRPKDLDAAMNLLAQGFARFEKSFS